MPPTWFRDLPWRSESGGEKDEGHEDKEVEEEEPKAKGSTTNETDSADVGEPRTKKRRLFEKPGSNFMYRFNKDTLLAPRWR